LRDIILVKSILKQGPYYGGEDSTYREQERRTGVRTKIRNTQRREVVGTDIREQSPKVTLIVVLK
jgi:hypothetical protein